MIRLVLSAALALATIAGAAHAQVVSPLVETSPVSRTVRYGDLDSSSSAGAQRLAFRIRTAARSVCGGDNPIVRTGMGFDDCVNRSIERAAAKLDNPMVDAALDLPSHAPAYARR